ncbi:MAG: hypothetical protein DCF32_02955 [Leptolyngbya sp.]|nr:MAG: hypothetical protein DCF32_02955 [Leptolyngbya sp.]
MSSSASHHNSVDQLEQFQQNVWPVHHLADPWFLWPSNSTVHMVVNNVYERDGVGNFVIALYKLLRQHEIPCQLYAEGYESYLESLVNPLDRLAKIVKPSDIIFVHFSIYLPNLDKIAALTCQKIICYYGITPPDLLSTFDQNLANQCQWGYDQGPLVRHFQKLAAISNASAKVVNSFLDAPRSVAIIPPVLNLHKWENIASEPTTLPPYRRRFLYVGRVVPHKKIDDLIRLYSAYHALDPNSCLLVTGFNDFGNYKVMLEALLEEQPRSARERIYFLGPVSDGQLKFLYQNVDAFWIMSEHEGFCIPLVEAMAFELPIFAFAQSAVRETLGESGLVFYQKDMQKLACRVYQVLSEDSQRRQLVMAQTQQFKQLVKDSDGRAIWRLFESCLGQIYASSI